MCMSLSLWYQFDNNCPRLMTLTPLWSKSQIHLNLVRMTFGLNKGSTPDPVDRQVASTYLQTVMPSSLMSTCTLSVWLRMENLVQIIRGSHALFQKFLWWSTPAIPRQCLPDGKYKAGLTKVTYSRISMYCDIMFRSTGRGEKKTESWMDHNWANSRVPAC